MNGTRVWKPLAHLGGVYSGPGGDRARVLVEYDPDELAALIRGAGRMRTGRSVRGPLRVTVRPEREGGPA
jgi:hypothetical protein